jgi:transmembrane sensor
LTIDSEHIDILITRYLSGEASDEERLQLEQWMDESETNKKYFGDIRFVHDMAVASHRIVKVDIEKAWGDVKKQMKPSAKGKSVPFVKMKFSTSLLLRIAAMFIIVSGLSFLIYKTYLSSSGKANNTHIIASTVSSLNCKLSDSTRVILSKHSKITYNSKYGIKQREVTLSGEAYFNVFHNDVKPFIVKAEEVLIKDLGTSFIIKAFPDSSSIEVSVESGEVMFYTTNNRGIRLFHGETGVYEKASKTFRKYETASKIVPGNNRFLSFQNDRLADVIEQLNSVYQTNIRLSNDSLGRCKITVTFNNENINFIVGIIAETLSLQVVKTADGYLLEGINYPIQ